MRIYVLISMIAISIFCFFTSSCKGQQMNEDNTGFNELTPTEKRIIEGKGTEAPFSGKYYKHSEKGTYICRRCSLPLFRSDDKFNSNCGWPSFDDEIPSAVRRSLDADGSRTEITCSHCGAHLGHVFEGEHMTPKNTRHCVNSVSMNFVPADEPLPLDRAFFAAGCFWGVEHMMENIEGVLDARSGYMGGHKNDPTYQQVCTGNTGHAETVEIIFDPSIVSYEELVKAFFEIHDFEQDDGQGPDIGEQYRSAVFYTTEEQRETVQKIADILRNWKFRITTEITEATNFWPAEEYHQDYYEKTGKTPYCHVRKKIFN